ncbi:MAG: hypothetical protein ACK4N5_27285, partial [Myxococcales bacterium]
MRRLLTSLGLLALLSPAVSGAAERGKRASGPDVEGVLIGVSPAAETITVLDPRTNYVVTLQLQDETILVVDGERANLHALREGETVRASFELVDRHMVARSVRQQEQPQQGVGGSGAAAGGTGREVGSEADAVSVPDVEVDDVEVEPV